MYQVQMVGSDLPVRLGDFTRIRRFLAETVLPQIGNVVRQKIQDKMRAYPFKHTNGNMMHAVSVRVDPAKLEVVIFNDNTRAPYAIYQEEGVPKQKMTWLIGKTIPYKIVGGRFVFAGRGSRLFGTSGVQFAKITANTFNKVNPVTGKPSWENPGYPGKYFYRDGLRESLGEIQGHFKHFTFRMAESSGENINAA